ncbi:MAG: 1-aminocyclopropane-1-carboxylate deaminase/D-cysteine desulfhydrase [Cytophagales bacterium]|nr:MAG: 1-aminocyclopropane-1-carboxylate deaminase/D-cysteine desulfhydrase [Cytophagales bacterium]
MPSPLEIINSKELAAMDISLFIKRDDLIHPYYGGNKWRKLKYNLIEMKKQNQSRLLTFGGAFSNHIYACAAAGKYLGFETIGIIRGEECLPLNPTLSFAASCGMKLYYLSRSQYQHKDSTSVTKSLENQFGSFYYLPEGGSNELALEGCKEIVKEIDIHFDYICSACGTGATLAGISSELKTNQKALGFAALKAEGYFEEQLNDFLKLNNDKSKYSIFNDYCFGGYAKINKELIYFMDWFSDTFNVSLDPVYTGKMMFGVFDLIRKGYFPSGSKIIAVHSGGLQGLEGMSSKINQLRVL